MATHSSILVWEIPWATVWRAKVHDVAEMDITKQLNTRAAHTHIHRQGGISLTSLFSYDTSFSYISGMKSHLSSVIK